MSVFLIVLIGVLLFIPGTLEPFTEGGQENIAMSNRIGDQLSEGMLGDPATPHVLNTSCTIAFFEDTNQAGCGYDGSDLNDRLGVTKRRYVNVTLEGNLSTADDGKEILCWSASQALIERDEGTCVTLFAIGDLPPPRADSTVTSRRAVSVNESAGSKQKEDVALVVEVW
jgi:hypothetical protein